jgi:hypothetical protein
MKAWISLTDTSAVKTYREVPALRNNAFRELVIVVCPPGFCRDVAKTDTKRRATLTRYRRVARAGQSSLQAWVAIARHSPAKGAAAEAIRVVA